jgi:hypothetical protein
LATPYKLTYAGLQLNNADVQRAVMGALQDSPELEGLLGAGQLVRAESYAPNAMLESHAACFASAPVGVSYLPCSQA